MGNATTNNRVEKLTEKSYKKSAQGKVEKQKPGNSDVYARKVEKKAYELFEKRGCQSGHAWDDWFEAEKIVETEMIAGK